MKPIPISFRQIEYLLAVAKLGGTAQASRALNVSQPSVSLAITRCEEVFGQKLFIRLSGQGMELTAFGQRKISELRGIDELARSVLSQNEDQAPRLDLGVFSTLGPRYGPLLVRSFQVKHPHSDLHIHEGDLQTLYTMLNEGRIDVALVYEFGASKDLDMIPLMKVIPYAIFPDRHRLAYKDKVSVEELQGDPVILMNLPHSRSFFLSVFQSNGINPDIAYETASIEMLRSMVANGFGVGLLATDIPSDVAYDGSKLCRTKLTGNIPAHGIALIRLKHLVERPIVRAFVDHTRGYFLNN